MAKEAITKGEIFSTIRNSGIDQIEKVKAIVMELNGQITVVKKSNSGGISSLDDIDLFGDLKKTKKNKSE